MSENVRQFIDKKIKNRKVMLFTKRDIPMCKTVVEILNKFQMKSSDFEICEIEKRTDCTQIETYFMAICLISQRQVPQLFIDGKYIGGYKEIVSKYESGLLEQILVKIGITNKRGNDEDEKATRLCRVNYASENEVKNMWSEKGTNSNVSVNEYQEIFSDEDRILPALNIISNFSDEELFYKS